jgi:hypothetical protein
MAASLGDRRFAGAAKSAVQTVVKFPGIRASDVHIGTAESGMQIGIDLGKLIEGRMLIQGASGAGKSWTLRRLIEQTHDQVQQIVIDPEGEFKQLADKLGLLHLEGHRLDMATLALAAGRAREHRASVVLDLSELDRDDQMKAMTSFVSALIAAPREHWHPTIVAIDEAHLFAPFGGYTEATSVRKASIATVTDLMSRGRKRGLAGILATQRLARLAKSVVSEALNFMVGLNTLDLDIRRAAETIGWDARKGFDRLPMLAPGDFVVVGPAFSTSPAVLKVGPVETFHVGAAPELKAPAARAPGDAARLLDLDALLAATAADQQTMADNTRPLALRQIRQFIREPGFADAGRIWGALAKLAPEGARVDDLGKHLNRTKSEIAAALALLDQYGVLEFSGDGDKRAVRIEKGMQS